MSEHKPIPALPGTQRTKRRGDGFNSQAAGMESPPEQTEQTVGQRHASGQTAGHAAAETKRGPDTPEQRIASLGDPELDPFELEFAQEWSGRGPRDAFVNEHGVVIGDYDYASPESPLQQWSRDTDPAVMAGGEWVHPYKDIGFHTKENRDLFEKGVRPRGGIFMHPEHDASYESEPGEERRSEDPEPNGKP